MHEPAAIAERNQVAWTRAKSAQAGHTVFDEPFALWAIPHRPAGVLSVTRLRLSEDTEEAGHQVERIVRTYQDAESPANWLLGPGATPADLARRLRKERRMMGPHYLSGMNADLSILDLPAPDRPAHVIEDWSPFEEHPLPLGLFFPKAMRADVLPLLRETAAALPGQVFPIVSWLDGRPAASVTLFVDDGVAGVYDVVTVPELRGRGAATAALRFALRLASDMGSRIATLQAYPKAAGLYERHGFVHVCRFASLYYSRTRMAADRLKAG